MTQVRLYELLKSTGYPVAHIEFKKAPSVPYIAYLFQGEEQHGSDFENLISSRTVVVELYTEYGDVDAELKLDAVLNFTEFSKDRVKMSDERLLMVVYEFDNIEKIKGEY